MRVNFDIVGTSVDKSHTIYLHFLLLFRFNTERLLRNSASEREILHSHGAHRRLSGTVCERVCVCVYVCVNERWGRSSGNIWNNLPKRALRERTKKRRTLISILTTASNSWRYIEEQAPLVPSTPLATFSAWTSSIFGDIMFSGCVRETTYDPVFGLVWLIGRLSPKSNIFNEYYSSRAFLRVGHYR